MAKRRPVSDPAAKDPAVRKRSLHSGAGGTAEPAARVLPYAERNPRVSYYLPRQMIGWMDEFVSSNPDENGRAVWTKSRLVEAAVADWRERNDPKWRDRA